MSLEDGRTQDVALYGKKMKAEEGTLVTPKPQHHHQHPRDHRKTDQANGDLLAASQPKQTRAKIIMTALSHLRAITMIGWAEWERAGGEEVQHIIDTRACGCFVSVFCSSHYPHHGDDDCIYSARVSGLSHRPLLQLLPP